MSKHDRFRIDAHVHLVAIDEKRHKSFMCKRKRLGFGFLYLRHTMQVSSNISDEEFDIAFTDHLASLIRDADYLDKAIVFAMDGRYKRNGSFDPHTEVVISNDWAIQAVTRHPDVFLFGASIHPDRTDALDELDKCAEAGAVCVKWVPPGQNIDPSDSKHEKFYARMKDHDLVLSSHTGYEHYLHVTDQSLGDPERLRLPLDTGLTVVACHSGCSGNYHRVEYFPNFAGMVNEYENLYGDTSAICALFRGTYRKRLLTTPGVIERLIQGTDYPVPMQPTVWPIALGPINAVKLQFHKNYFDRDYLAKKGAGFPHEHFLRGHDVFLGAPK